MPPDVAFSSREYWVSTIVHEINHSTGHAKRMNRDMTGSFGSEKYSQEEARVEMAAALVCNTLNLPTDFAKSRGVCCWLAKETSLR
jgi:antirestriction protein ArdC